MPAVTRRPRLTRRQFLRAAGFAGAVTAIGGSLAACNAPDQPLPPEAAAAATASATAAERAARGGTVKWAQFYSSLTSQQEKALGINARANQDWMAGIARKFEQEHPGWQVVLEAMPYDELDRRLASDANAHLDHDLVFVTPQLIPRHGQLRTLLDLTPFLKNLIGFEQDDLSWNGAWRAGSPDGQAQLAVPIGLHAFGLAYNRSRFQAAGIDPDQPFRDLDQVATAAKTLTGPGNDSWGLGLYVGPGWATVEQLYAPLVWNFGGDIYDPAAGAATLANEANTRAAGWLVEVTQNMRVVPPAGYAGQITPEEALSTAFVKGQVAQSMGFGAGWLPALQSAGMVSGCVPATKECQPGQAGVMVMPATGNAQFVGGRCLAIARSSREPGMAFNLLRSVLLPDNLKAYPDAGLPARLSAWQAPDYNTPFYQTWLAAARAGRPMPATPYYAELAAVIARALDQILNHGAPIPATLQRAQDDWNGSYARA